VLWLVTSLAPPVLWLVTSLAPRAVASVLSMPPPTYDPWAMKRYYTKQMRSVVASLCGTFGEDDDIDDSVANRRRLMLGEETYDALPGEASEDHGVTRGNYVPVTLTSMPPDSSSVKQPAPSSPKLAAAAECVAAASACVAASMAASSSASGSSEHGCCAAHTLPAAAIAPAAAAPTAPTSTHSAQEAGASSEAEGMNDDMVPVDLSAPSEDDSTAVARQRLEDVMAQVQDLEDQGRLVEASALMVESMRLQASLAGR
jgi:hypothetical protein